MTVPGLPLSLTESIKGWLLVTVPWRRLLEICSEVLSNLPCFKTLSGNRLLTEFRNKTEIISDPCRCPFYYRTGRSVSLADSTSMRSWLGMLQILLLQPRCSRHLPLPIKRPHTLRMCMLPQPVNGHAPSTSDGQSTMRLTSDIHKDLLPAHKDSARNLVSC